MMPRKGRQAVCELAALHLQKLAIAVISAISGHRADLFALGNLTEQFGQDRTVAIAAGGEFD